MEPVGHPGICSSPSSTSTTSSLEAAIERQFHLSLDDTNYPEKSASLEIYGPSTPSQTPPVIRPPGGAERRASSVPLMTQSAGYSGRDSVVQTPPGPVVTPRVSTTSSLDSAPVVSALTDVAGGIMPVQVLVTMGSSTSSSSSTTDRLGTRKEEEDIPLHSTGCSPPLPSSPNVATDFSAGDSCPVSSIMSVLSRESPTGKGPHSDPTNGHHHHDNNNNNSPSISASPAAPATERNDLMIQQEQQQPQQPSSKSPLPEKGADTCLLNHNHHVDMDLEEEEDVDQEAPSPSLPPPRWPLSGTVTEPHHPSALLATPPNTPTTLTPLPPPKVTLLTTSTTSSSSSRTPRVVPATAATAVPRKKKRSMSSSLSAAGQSCGRWTPDEHQAFLRGLQLHGREWKRVASDIPTRTSAQVRSHAQKYFAKIQREEEGWLLAAQQQQAPPAVPPLSFSSDPAAASFWIEAASTSSSLEGDSPLDEAAFSTETPLPASVQAQAARIMAHPESVEAEVKDTMRQLRERYRLLQERWQQRQQQQQPAASTLIHTVDSMTSTREEEDEESGEEEEKSWSTSPEAQENVEAPRHALDGTSTSTESSRLITSRVSTSPVPPPMGGGISSFILSESTLQSEELIALHVLRGGLPGAAQTLILVEEAPRRPPSESSPPVAVDQDGMEEEEEEQPPPLPEEEEDPLLPEEDTSSTSTTESNKRLRSH